MRCDRIGHVFDALQGEGVPITRVPEIIQGIGTFSVTYLVQFDQGYRRLEMMIPKFSIHSFRWVSIDEGNGRKGGRAHEAEEDADPYTDSEVNLRASLPIK